MATRKARWAAGIALLGLAGTAAAGDIYVCKGTHGEKVYQNTACTTPASQLGHNTYSDAMARPSTTPAYAPLPEQAAQASAPAYSANQAATPRAPIGGIGSSSYQRGERHGMRCVTARGRVYYTAHGCGTSVVSTGMQVRDWHDDTVRDMPGATMVGPNEAVNPMTGQVTQLQSAPDMVPTSQLTRDAGTAVSVDEACAGARRAAAGRFDKTADDRVQDLCRFGRSMNDQLGRQP